MNPDKGPIWFKFRPECFVEALAYLSSQRIIRLTPLKVAKLFYLADQRLVRTAAQTLFGDTYYFFDHGATPLAAYDAMRTVMAKEVWQPEYSGLFRSNHIKASKSGFFFRRHQRTLKNPWPNLPQSSLNALEWVLDQYRHYSVQQLVELTPKGKGVMDHRQFFEGCTDAEREYLELLELEQEDRDHLASLESIATVSGDPFNVMADPLLCLVLADTALKRVLLTPRDAAVVKEWQLLVTHLLEKHPELSGLEKHRRYLKAIEARS